MQRTFIIGDKWIYYKLYCGEKTADLLLTEVVKPVSQHLVKNKLIDKWFFIRYADPKHHLRWRLLLTGKNHLGDVVLNIFENIEPYLKSGFIHSVQIDTYKRELERYGNYSMELSEWLFFYESKMITEFIDLIEGEEGEKLRWLFSMKYIDELLSGFDFSLQQKFDLLNNLADGFGKEFNLNSPLIMQLSDKFRKNKKEIFDFMNTEYFNNNYPELYKLIATKRNSSKKITSDILKLNEAGQLKIPLENILNSYIHMFMNRLFRSKQRVHEMVIYGFLFRYYRTRVAREKYGK